MLTTMDYRAGIVCMNMVGEWSFSRLTFESRALKSSAEKRFELPLSAFSLTLPAPATGAAKHCKKALDVGMDLICCQGGEGGGHTGDSSSSAFSPRSSPFADFPISSSPHLHPHSGLRCCRQGSQVPSHWQAGRSRWSWRNSQRRRTRCCSLLRCFRRLGRHEVHCTLSAVGLRKRETSRTS